MVQFTGVIYSAIYRCDKYQISEFGSIIIYMIYRDTSQVLMLLVGQNDPQQCTQTRMLMLPNVMMFIECPITRFTVHQFLI